MTNLFKKTTKIIGQILLVLLVALLILHGLHYIRNMDQNKPPHGYPNLTFIKIAWFLKLEKLVDRNPEVPPDIVAYPDIEYKKVGNHSLQLDIYRLKNLNNPRPLLVFIHGGGFRTGKRQDYLVYLIDFAKRGYVTATVSYRLSREAKFPAAVKDVKCAIKWLKLNAKDYFIDPDKIAVIGGSAGGHLVQMIAFSPGEPYFQGECPADSLSSRVAAAVDFYGPSDLTTPIAISRKSVIDFIGSSFRESPELYRKASPRNYISSDDPPTLIFQGTIDQTVPVGQSDSLKKWLDEAGVPNEYERISGWPHTMDAVESVNKYAQRRMTAFFEKYLAKEN